MTYKKEVLGIVYMINKSLLIPETLGLALLDVNWMSSSCFSTCNMNYDANGSKLTGLLSTCMLFGGARYSDAKALITR